jgi:glucose-6-phosphate 1-dehydrogenase
MSQKKPCQLVLFGTQGDLAQRKLLPALYRLEVLGLLSPEFRIVGVARKPMACDAYQAFVKASLEQHIVEPLQAAQVKKLLSRCQMVAFDFQDKASFKALAEVLDAQATSIFYFATPPAVYANICQGLNHAGLVSSDARVVLEKPIGRCLASSAVINDAVSTYFQENQIYRIDHYLGKETVQNLLALRLSNAIFASQWDHSAIDHIQITVAETVGIEGRWGYFDGAGQMRDMVQNHLLQILSLLAMDPPNNLSADSIRDEKVKVLRALRPIKPETVAQETVLGQYAAGQDGMLGYLHEEGANTQSDTETYVALKVHIDNWRWAGVPFYLRSGKRMPEKTSEVVVAFKNPPHDLYQVQAEAGMHNQLTLRLQPDEGIEMHVLNKVPGLTSAVSLQKTKLNFSFSESFEGTTIADAYERLLLEVILGHQALFVRRDEVEAAWAWVDGVFKAWEKTAESPKPYPAGSWGPVASMALINQDGRTWNK